MKNGDRKKMKTIAEIYIKRENRKDRRKGEGT